MVIFNSYVSLPEGNFMICMNPAVGTSSFTETAQTARLFGFTLW
jgi:hypothetical protein